MIKKGIFFLAVAVPCILGVTAYADVDLTPEKQTLITQNCVLSQTILQKVQHNDAATRVNRGEGYETVVARLMTPLNSRTASRGYNDAATTLIDVTKRYQDALDSFKNDYRDYDNTISSALRIKCQKDPSGFYNYIDTARKQRAQLTADISNLSALISEYRANVEKLKGQL